MASDGFEARRVDVDWIRRARGDTTAKRPVNERIIATEKHRRMPVPSGERTAHSQLDVLARLTSEIRISAKQSRGGIRVERGVVRQLRRFRVAEIESMQR